jgi:primosomal protein N' (replication factor Y)
VRALAKREWLTLASENVRRDPLSHRNILRTNNLALMPEQAAALTAIRECGVNAAAAAPAGKRLPSVLLLHGVTGSGKTEVYLQAIEEFLLAGKGAIVLVPEIALTPQTVERFVGRFGPRVAVLHSHLSEGERHDEWHRIHEGVAQIVVGARSAVFAPVRDLGLIVVDEEHEPSYKQDEAPRYNARDVAVMRGHMEGCAVVLGSATPSLESWRNAQTGKYRLASLPRRADNCRMPHVEIVDMRIETERTGHASVFSRELAEAIHQRLQKKEQTMLFLNRRGFATSLVCPKCGFVAKCDFCSVTLTYHKTDDHLRCHVCGSNQKAPARCPACADPAFKFSGVGTQRVETVAQKFFPHARIQRMDTDVTGAKDSYERILGDFRSGKIDILIGTQMIAKGLHFPNVTLVGVVYADLSLHMPDFRAGERTFQLLAQVAGRAGRGEVPGEVFVQTYTPFHVAVQAARRTDYAGFCDQELEFRRELKYPPFGHLVCVTLRGLSEERTSFYADSLAKALQLKLASGVILSEPSPAPLARAKSYYRFQFMLRHPSTKAMTVPLRETLRTFKLPDDVSLIVDVDALSIM